jgi:hypothetical protein
MVVLKLIELAYGTPRKLPKPSMLAGRVAVLDIAFASNAGGASFQKVTKPFIDGLGARLAVWVDHHDHDMHASFRDDARFVLCTKQEHPACPEMVTEELVQQFFPVHTICCHIDFDGLCAAAKWLREGIEPYDGADEDARCIDTRMGEPSERAVVMDRALRARPKDEGLRHLIVRYLAEGATDAGQYRALQEAAKEMDVLQRNTEQIARRYRVYNSVALVCVDGQIAFDKTQLLLMGQTLAPVAIVYDAHTLTAAAKFDSGVNFISMLGLGGGMPTRVSVASRRLPELLRALSVDVSVL